MLILREAVRMDVRRHDSDGSELRRVDLLAEGAQPEPMEDFVAAVRAGSDAVIPDAPAGSLAM